MPLTDEEKKLLQEAMSELEAQYRDLKDHPTHFAKYDAIVALHRKLHEPI